MKFTLRDPDVLVWASLNGRPAKLVIAASQDRISTVVVNGESFRSLGLEKEDEICERVVNKPLKFRYTGAKGLRCIFPGFQGVFFKFTQNGKRSAFKYMF
jgi:uncharacterized protein YfaA (DUF2138 family)